MTEDNNRLVLSRLADTVQVDRRQHWLTRGVCVLCGRARACPRRAKLAAARAWKSLSRRLDVPGVRLHLLTVTTGRPSSDLRARVEQLRQGVRRLMQSRKLSGVSAIEWTLRAEGYHVHAHVVFLGENPWPPPVGWLSLRREAVRAGLGSVANIQPARKRGGLFAARYVLKYVSKGLASEDRPRLLRGRRLWNGHGSLAAWKGSPGALHTLQLEVQRRREYLDAIRAKQDAWPNLQAP